ncbi:taste receptor type 1 member 1-like [Denticeps clupeoides]|uniref:taste receptor type 1 member 1-like n=1 Tax=Denticeps clupeoides TaxID=299321 RepID=UPI0010A2DC3E|nr:taste receptor type 1 member 1-like [Denticeps clupeoides]
MQRVAFHVFLLAHWHHIFFQTGCQASEFTLPGEYLLGGLFPMHYPEKTQVYTKEPEALVCAREPLYLQGYQIFQVMRFAVEQINNSTAILPNVTLGYDIFDHCSDAENFPSLLQFFSQNGSIKVRTSYNMYQPKVIGFTGPLSSTESMTAAPLFMMDLIPMIGYAATSNAFSDKWKYPSFLRTVPSNREQIKLIIYIIQHFGWNWVAFIGSKDEYSENALKLFYSMIGKTNICLAYQELLTDSSKHNVTLYNINRMNINVIIVFTENFIQSAIQFKVQDKVWIASDAWSMDPNLSKLKGINKVGTIFGVTTKMITIPGFSEFVYKSQEQSDCAACDSNPDLLDQAFCNQDCENCTTLHAANIINQSPIYSFPVYAAIYAMANALHNALSCSETGCNKSQTIYPYMILQEIKKLNFSLLGQYVTFDAENEPPASFTILLWRTDMKPVVFQTIGTYETQPVFNFTIYDEQIMWHKNRTVPFANCSAECKPGFVRKQDGLQRCCFQCVECGINYYANQTVDLYTCLKCQEDEWSTERSSACIKRSVEYLHFNEPLSIMIMVSATVFILLVITVSILFAYNYNTPVVRSAGGSMCFLMLGSLGLSSLSVFFYFGKPQPVDCALRNMLFIYFYTVCLACLGVRSFQIVCIFKMAAKFPKVHTWWVKHNGQWLVIIGITVVQTIICTVWMSVDRPMPQKDTESFRDKMLLNCDRQTMSFMPITLSFTWFLSFLCFCFSYMGTDLPKNYNEAKAITFSLLLFYVSWIVNFTTFLMSKDKYVQLVDAAAELFSAYGILFSYFLPKSYIIVFEPQKNTQEFFQSSIQSYTQTISRM